LHENRNFAQGTNEEVVGQKPNVKVGADRFVSGQTCVKCGALFCSHGLEPQLEQFIQNEVEVLRAVRRVLRDDACLFLNLGDSYAAGKGQSACHYPEELAQRHQRGETLNREYQQAGGGFGITRPQDDRQSLRNSGLKPLDLCMVPARVALALQADGWYLRSAITWIKGMSLNPDYSGSVMPESVSGWKWTRCKVKVDGKGSRGPTPSGWDTQHNSDPKQGRYDNDQANLKWQDCPGCAKCESNGGYVLERGSWRPTSGTEMVFMLTKSPKYYADQEAVKEKSTDPESFTGKRQRGRPSMLDIDPKNCNYANIEERTGSTYPTRNLRNVFWCMPDFRSVATDALILNPSPTKEKHYATFPQRLCSVLIKAATPEHGVCPKCGAPWARVVNIGEKEYLNKCNSKYDGNEAGAAKERWSKDLICSSTTLGWRPTCGCYPPPKYPAKWKEHYDSLETIPALVLDCFGGSCTTAVVAKKLFRNYLMIELSPEYIDIANKRLADTGGLF